MNDFEAELRELIEKYRDHPGSSFREMYRALNTAAVEVLADGVRAAGPFVDDTKYSGL